MKPSRSSRCAVAGAAVLAIAVAVGCATAKPVAQAAEQPAAQATAQPAAPAAPAAPQVAAKPAQASAGTNIVQTEALGFSPTAENAPNSIDLALSFAKPEAVKSWKVEIATGRSIRKTFAGKGSALPSSLAWDGKTDGGSLAEDGSYVASLSVDYGDAFKPGVATSNAFILDSTAPTGSLALSPPLFSPMADTDRVTIAIAGKSNLAKLDSWSLDIFDPGDNLFKSFDGKWPDAKISWDGRGISGSLVVSAEDYPLVLKIRDQFGNVGVVKSEIPIDILVIKQGNGYRIANSRVYFKDFTADYKDVPPELARQNALRLDQLAEKLKKFPGYKVKIVGHAVMINWDDPVRGKAEQDSVLIPLSQARADAIKQAMVERGLDAGMLTSVGVGAADPLVPDSDYAQRWQNRRTALFLDK